MKYLIPIALLLAFSQTMLGQDLKPVTWESEVILNEDGQHSLILTANIDKNWYLYSQHTSPDGPVPTKISLTTNGIELVGEFKETSKAYKGMSDMFGVEVIKFSKEAKFQQDFIPGEVNTITGTVTFMTCDGLRCLAPTTIEFSQEL